MNKRLLKYILTVLLIFGAEVTFAQQTQVVTGRVTEIINNRREPLIGVNVNLVNSQNRSVGGTVTDIDGQYILRIPSNENDITIVYTFIGMKPVRIAFTGQDALDITMEDASKTLDEIVVVGQRLERNNMGIGREEMVSSTQKIQMDDIVSNSPVVSVEDALQGRLGGVDIIMGGGDPGARSSIRIRGTNSLNSSSEPLIVVDGVPYSTTIDDNFDFSTANDEDLGALLNIAPTDIESVEVLKDASATAIWGTKGGNGVLVINTKKGSMGKTRFSFSSKLTTNYEPNPIPMLDGNEYTALMQEAIWNSANYIGLKTGNPYLKLLYDTPEIGYNPNWYLFDEYNQNTDWLKEVRRDAVTWDNNFSMSGGGEKANYRLSLGYLSDEGVTIGTNLDRLNSTLRIDYNFSRKLKFGSDFAYTQSNKDDNFASNVRSEAFSKMPNKSPYWIDENGNRTSQYFSHQTRDFEGEYRPTRNYNPVAMVHESYNNTTSKEGKITFRMDYNILSNLTYNGYASINLRTTRNTKFLPQVATGVVWTSQYANQSTDAMSDRTAIQTQNKLMFVKKWNDMHDIIATGVFRTSQSQSSSYTSTTSGNASSGLADPIIGSTVESMNSGESESRNISSVFLVNYTLLRRYVLQTSLTMEANSSMGKDNRMGVFPTVGVSWNIDNEPFIEEYKDWLEIAKLRFSVGQSGNSPSGSSYYGAYTALGEYMNYSGIHPIRMQLDNLKWETSTEYNFGADLSLFKGKLKFTFDYYKKNVRDLLQRNVSIPSSTGYATISYFNSGEMINKGWEFRTDGVLFENKDWNVSSYLNFSRNLNEITKLPENLSQDNYTFGNGRYAIQIEEGRPFGSFYGYRYNGVYQNIEATYARNSEDEIMNDVNGDPIVMKNGTRTVFPGDAIYDDINHDGVINEYDIVYIGNYMPIITGGAGLSVRYKQISMNAFFHGRFGHKIINRTRINNESMYSVANQSQAVLRRWRNEGDDTDIPRALYNEGFNYLGSDRFVEDASYVRLKSISVNYNFPRELSNKLGFSNMSAFVTGYNLFTWTGYTGQDPEVSIPGSANRLAEDNANTPISRRISFGINLNF